MLEGESFGLDPDVLASRAYGLSSLDVCETPYVGVRCELREPEATELETPRASSPIEAAGILRQALGRVVDRTLGSARRVAVMASGGVDSAGLLVLAQEWARRTGGSVFAISLEFATRGDDRPHLRALEAKLGCEVLRLEPEEAASRLSLLAGVDGAPLCVPSAPLEIELMARARAHGAECVLTGAGGDDIFDGHPRSLAFLARRGRVREAVRMTRRLRGFQWDRPRVPLLSWIVRPLAARFVPAGIRMHIARRIRATAPPWSGPRLLKLLERQRVRALSDLAHELRQGRHPGDGATPDLSPEYRAYLAWLRHQEEVASGIERRDPFLDRGLVALMRSFPPDWLLFGGIRRGLFREAFRGALPDSVRLREDKAFSEPSFARMVAADGGLERFRSLSRRTELASLGIVEAAPFAEAFDAFAAADQDLVPWKIWYFLGLEAFLRAKTGRSW